MNKKEIDETLGNFHIYIKDNSELIEPKLYKYNIFFKNEIILDDYILGNSLEEVKREVFNKLVNLTHDMYNEINNIIN